jgi:hypothetical protein
LFISLFLLYLSFDKEKTFILSVKKGEPQWDLIELKGINLLPAVQWKLLNLSWMDKKKRKLALSKLENTLSETDS